MLKTLFKKQIYEVFSWIWRNAKTGKNRNKKQIVGFVALYLAIFGFLGYNFYSVAASLCKPLYSVGYGWIYWAIMGLITMALGVFGSVFNTYASLYTAKDNDLLLSLPISTSKILLARLLGVYLMGAMYELIIAVPTLICFFINAKLTVIGSVFALLSPVVISFFVLALSCIFGFLVAVINSKLKKKNIMTVIFSLLFMAAYFFIYGNAYEYIGKVLINPAAFSSKAKIYLYPLYRLGLSCDGNVLSGLIFILITALFLAVVYYVLNISFIKVATANRGANKKKYKQKRAKVSSVESALLKKELLRFVGSPSYMLNCGLGILFLPIAAVVILVNRLRIATALETMLGKGNDIVPLIIIAGITMIMSMNDMAAPSVSLEGKSIWIPNSLPIDTKKILLAKVKLQIVLSIIPLIILITALEIVFKMSLAFAVLIPVICILYLVFTSFFGLFLNLKFPNLDWTNEIVPIKQSASVSISIFGDWALVAIFGGCYFFLRKFITPIIFALIILALLITAVIVLYNWTVKRGTKIFESLHI